MPAAWAIVCVCAAGALVRLVHMFGGARWMHVDRDMRHAMHVRWPNGGLLAMLALIALGCLCSACVVLVRARSRTAGSVLINHDFLLRGDWGSKNKMPCDSLTPMALSLIVIRGTCVERLVLGWYSIFRLADPGRSASLDGASTPFNNYF